MSKYVLIGIPGSADMILDNSGNEDEAVAKLVAMIKEHGAVG